MVTEMVGGTTFGYCATASLKSDTAPITTMRTASTFARTGRSMKNFEIMTRGYFDPVGSAAADFGVCNWGSTFWPGTASRMPDTTTRSSALRPLSTTRISPVV